MKELKLPPCHIEFYYGHEMHTEKIGRFDEAKWVYHNCDESKVKDNVLYKVWLTRSTPADPADQSSYTNVYYFEEVPAELVEMKMRVEKYWNSKEPIEF